MQAHAWLASCREAPPWDPLVVEAACYPRRDESCPRLLGEIQEAPIAGFCMVGSRPIVAGKGHAAVVLVARTPWGYAAVKIRRRDSKKPSLAGEALLASRAHAAGAAPPVYWWGGEVIVYGLAAGPLLGDIMSRGAPPPSLIVEALEAARALDAAGILHEELSRPWRHVVFTDGRALILDYDSARAGCGSVTRLAAGILARIGGAGILQGLRPLLAEYKKRCGRREYEEIVRAVMGAMQG